jgi:hypothetical protein
MEYKLLCAQCAHLSGPIRLYVEGVCSECGGFGRVSEMTRPYMLSMCGMVRGVRCRNTEPPTYYASIATSYGSRVSSFASREARDAFALTHPGCALWSTEPFLDIHSVLRVSLGEV